MHIIQSIGLQFKFNNMSPNSVPAPWLAVLILAIGIAQISCQQNCDSQSATTGCFNCSTTGGPYWLAFNTSSQKYTCTTQENCSATTSSGCSQCYSPYIIDTLSKTCVQMAGCIQYSNGTCLQCYTNYYLNTDGNCVLKSIEYCLEYNDTSTVPKCIRCLHYYMDPATNCTINATMCEQFDYQTMVCVLCPANTTVHSDGLSCYVPVDYCLVYNSSNPSECLLCDTNYMYDIDAAIPACVLAQPRKVKYQTLDYTYNNSLLDSYAYTFRCLDINTAYNTSTQTCSTPITNHCITNSTPTQCTVCAPGYYLSTGKCLECAIYIGYCVQCTNVTICTQCTDGYYVLNVSATETKCMPCSSYKCATCTTQLNPDAKVQCLSCPINSTLYDGSCVSCSSAGYAYSISESKCLPCNSSIPNCRFCQFTADPSTPTICLQCTQGYYYNGTECIQIINTTTVVTLTNAAQILAKSAPGIEKALFNDRIALMSACYTVDGFVCNCTSANLTSLCTNFDYTPNVTQLIFATYSNVAQYSNELRMAAQFPTFNYATQMTFTTTPAEMLSEYQFWNVLSAYTYVINRNQAATDVPTAATKDIVGRIFTLSTTSMAYVFSDQKITILRGNGFYYKFIPTGLKSGGTGDDDYITTYLSSAQPVIIYVRFNRLQQAGFITGTIYIYTANTAAMAVKVRKTRYASYTGNNTLKHDGSLKDTTAALADGYLTVANFPKSTVAAPVGVQVYVNASDTTTDAFQSQRIQNIFYSQSWLYILFFIALYLIFIPLCAIVDCCQPDHIMRKKVGSEEQGPENDSEDVTIVRVNYRDFFPLYNVGNTPRPRRLTKVCLFIVNMQHIITFLTLIYFNLPGGLPVAAIALVIPGYLCTVVMGYIVGALFRLLPGNFKYLINLFTLGYWILWIFLMRLMNNNSINSREYRLYILVFSILSFFLDMVIDALQTLLVYFAIKQGEKQVSLFNCLARWLSLRGYYEFDKLAKQLGNPDD